MNKYPERAIFVSYRRQDSQLATRHLLERLSNKFGKSTVFFDIDSIPLGTNFRTNVRSALSKCWITVVVIGERWLTIKGQSGQPRLFEKDDLLRTEIELSLRRGIHVVPVAIGNARMPKEDELPESIRELAHRSGIELRNGRRVDLDIASFLNDIETILSSNEPVPDIGRRKKKKSARESSSDDRSFLDEPEPDSEDTDVEPIAEPQHLPEDLREELSKIQRSPDAQYLIGQRFLEGQGVERNLFEATKWFRKAAEEGHGKAEYELGLIYEFGRGVPYDHDKAVEWLRKAADNGVEAATAFLGKSLPR